MPMKEYEQKQSDVRELVRTQYGAIATTPNASCCSGGGCCGTATPHTALAQAIGYDEESLSYVPEGADMGLSCGNPLAIAALQPGATVVDLGSGGGFDVSRLASKWGQPGGSLVWI